VKGDSLQVAHILEALERILSYAGGGEAAFREVGNRTHTSLEALGILSSSPPPAFQSSPIVPSQANALQTTLLRDAGWLGP
jgi:hypothetical protein